MRVAGRRVDRIVRSDHEGHVSGGELAVDLIHLPELFVGDVGFGQQHVHVAGHAAGDGMDGVLDFDAPLLELVGELLQRMLSLGDGKSVAGDDDHLAGVGEHGADILRAARPDGLALGRGGGGAGASLDLAEGSEEHVGEGAAHCLAHQRGQQGTRGAYQRPRHDQGKVVQHEAGGRDRETGEGIEERDDHRHIGPADREDKGHAQHQGQYEQWHEEDRLRRHHEVRDSEANDRDRDEGVDDLLTGIRDRRAGDQPLQFGEGDGAAGERDAADHHGENAREPDLERGVQPLVQEFGNGDQCGGPAADSVEGGDHLWHGGHVYSACGDGSDRRPDREAK